VSIALYMDENVPRPITLGLRLRGVDVLTVQEDGYSGLDDLQVLDRAKELQRVVFSQDEDFFIETNRRQTKDIDFLGVIYVHQRSISIGDCVRDLEIIAQAANFQEFVNRVLYIPL
jgi:predicted nuclease of predicted toxin-antitoxin system